MGPRISSVVIKDFPAEIPWNEFQYGILESPWDTRFVEIAGTDNGLTPARYETGLLFGPDAELRWRRRRNGQYHLVFISDKGEAWPGAPDVAELTKIGEGAVLTNEAHTGSLNTVKVIQYRLDVEVPQPGGKEPVTCPVFLDRCAGSVLVGEGETR